MAENINNKIDPEMPAIRIPLDPEINELVDVFREKKILFELFSKQVLNDFLSSPELNTGVPSVIHSVRSRIKDERHMYEKIVRKRNDGRVITRENILTEITDFAGLRILHLHQNQFSSIYKFIDEKVRTKNWKLLEKPVAYTWDPESVDYFKNFKIKTSVKPSYYTSVHFLIAPANRLDGTCCEVQVRTLFEEVWGEIDHSINYPNKTDQTANIEQLRVLSKLVSTGSRLADSIFKIHEERGA
ncbi:RelA/SpoT domain-containing protein [Janthinobacterium sp. 13]|uniref:RelA/SpoT domain-containing protein n=1 Tax=Janthinobacterium sp. 13 TaxID=2035211 RepID=UPI000C5CD504|nr:RelA/SpoT domain-containing protein [Janthinobacterium sp. 13]PIF08096.1 ppGpp synthetase/RelA/SpoT-type nucleotidyltransferase [Janthinobacterium sp. 13]